MFFVFLVNRVKINTYILLQVNNRNIYHYIQLLLVIVVTVFLLFLSPIRVLCIFFCFSIIKLIIDRHHLSVIIKEITRQQLHFLHLYV